MNMKLLKLDPDQTLEKSPDSNVEHVEVQSEYEQQTLEESSNSYAEHDECNNEVQSEHEQQTLPMFEKFEQLNNKVMNLRKDHMSLFDEVKSITYDSFPWQQVSGKIQVFRTICL